MTSADSRPAAVLLDFSRTLFHLWFTAESLADIRVDGRPLSAADRARAADVLTAASTALPAELRADWDRRDLDAEVHRTVYLAALRCAGLDAPGVAETLYERMIDPAEWQPYPDTRAALERLRAAGVPVAVVSNIAWDIRNIFALRGLAELVDEFVLSYAEGVVKPDPKIFRLACDRLGVPPADTLMIGDNEEADSGASAVGARVEIIPGVPPDQRPDGLLTALAKHGL
ncbi:MAG TPA: HAD-IA family hydrolase [Pseudonocardiaceae bacterium]|nr:HAD-IA family hydrolase [Pseudonocardiaceae bacterium]